MSIMLPLTANSLNSLSMSSLLVVGAQLPTWTEAPISRSIAIADR
jgi:hypothetical protein